MYKLFVLSALLAVALAGNIDSDAHIVSELNEVNYDGSYQYRYETSNGIAVQEAGVGGQSANGVAQWYAPDGTPFQLTYVADENGFQPSGSHLPVPPPVPAAIIRALEWIRTHPPKDEGRRF